MLINAQPEAHTVWHIVSCSLVTLRQVKQLKGLK